MTDTKDETGRLPPIDSAQPVEKSPSKEPVNESQQVPDKDTSTNQILPVSETEDKSKLISTQKPAGVAKGDPAPPKKPAKTPRSKKDKDESFKFILGYAKRECGSISLGILFLIGGSLSDLAVPLFIGRVIDYIQKEDYDAVGTLCLYMLIVILVSGICVGMRAAIFNILSERIARNLRRDFYESIINKDIAFFDERRTGDLISRLNSDIQVIQDTLGTNVSMFVRGVLFILTVLVILCIISPPLTGMTFAGIIPLVLFSQFYQRWMRKLQRVIQSEKGKMNTIAEESFSNIRTVKAFSNEDNEIQKFSTGNLIVYQAGRKKAVYQAIFAFMTQIMLYGAMAAVVYVASKLYQDGEITIGEISSFMFYMLMLVFNFSMVAMVFGNVASIVGASDKIVELMQFEPAIKSSGGDTIQGEINGGLEIRNVKFRYPSKDDVQVLKGVSLSVDNQKNRVVALCGTSGCGKSSIISLIERFYDPEEGEVLFNGRNIKDLDPRWYHNQIAIVQQEPVLFSGSIRENITYGLDLDGMSDDEIIALMDEATRQSNAYDFIHDTDLFPLQYDTMVGERGVKLSGGQKQRIAIARALIRKPKLLLLDEATSALDAESEHQVQQALDKLISSGQQTVVVVAHRLSTIRDANEIIVMQYGEVKERGSHSELLALNGVYKNLVSRQLVAEEIEKDNDAE